LESLARTNRRPSRLDDGGLFDSLATINGGSDNISSRRLGSRAAPILIDDIETPMRLIHWTALPRPQLTQPTPIQDTSVEVLEQLVARQPEEAVTSQSTFVNGETIITFNNMTCVICMDTPRNLSMVPCGMFSLLLF